MKGTKFMTDYQMLITWKEYLRATRKNWEAGWTIQSIDPLICQALEQSCKIALPSNWPDMESVKIASYDYKNSEVSIDHQIPLPWFFSIIEAVNSRTHSIKLTFRKPEEQEEETDLVTETGRAVSLKAQLFQKFIPRNSARKGYWILPNEKYVC